MTIHELQKQLGTMMRLVHRFRLSQMQLERSGLGTDKRQMLALLSKVESVASNMRKCKALMHGCFG